jgi:hypothetical protein
MIQVARMSKPINTQLAIRASRQAQAPRLRGAKAANRRRRSRLVVHHCTPLQAWAAGNPKGRAKQSQNLRMIKASLQRQIQIREGDRPRRMPRIEALVRTTFTRAFKDPKALAALLVLLRQCGYGADHDEPAGDMLFGPDYPAIIDDFLARNGAKNAASDDEVDTVSVTVNSAKREG